LQVVELKGNIRVFVRVRPALPGEPGQMPFDFVDTGHGMGDECQIIEVTEPLVSSPLPKRSLVTCPIAASVLIISAHSVPMLFASSSPSGEWQVNRGGLSEKRRRWRFSYDQVFGPRVSQEGVFAEVQPLVQSAIDGYRVCIFAYGQTGSGKTFTMLGPGEDGGCTTHGQSASEGHRARRQSHTEASSVATYCLI
jgi:hypothetical protein